MDPDGEFGANDRTHNEYLDRMESALREVEGWPRDKPPPDAWQTFRSLCLGREAAGRERWGAAHLTKDNLSEAVEEAADFANYLYFDLLCARRERGEHEDLSLALTACWHSYRAYLATQQLRAKRTGAP